MSCLKNPNYVREFAYRTKYNYYRNMCTYGEEKTDYQEKLEKLEKQMEKEGYVIEQYYEVTDLLNSMIGLLVFPEQNLYNSLSTDSKDVDKFFPYLSMCMEKNYINTYDSTQRADNDSPREIIRHIKNAFSHNRVMIYPKNKKNEKVISKIIIQDCKPIESLDKETKKYVNNALNNHIGDVRKIKKIRIRNIETEIDINDYINVFSIEIPIERLEKVIMELCDYALKVSG